MSCIQKVEWTKPVFEQTLSTDQPLYWALLNVPVLICLNIFFFKAQDDDVEDMMEYATSGEFALRCISVESYFF